MLEPHYFGEIIIDHDDIKMRFSDWDWDAASSEIWESLTDCQKQELYDKVSNRMNKVFVDMYCEYIFDFVDDAIREMEIDNDN